MRTYIVSILLVLFAIELLKIKSWGPWRIVVFTSIWYVIIYEIFDKYKPIKLLPLQLIWMLSIVIILIGAMVSFLSKR